MSGEINLALQGGGTHGAYTWGVLDSILADERININSISGTSAGAMNAVVLANGFLKDGREGARTALTKFWENIASVMPANFSPLPVNSAVNNIPQFSLSGQFANWFTPSQLNPFNINPLRTLVKKHIDFELLAKYSPIKLYISATQANTGQLRVFKTEEITCDSLLASACLPSLMPAEIIDNEPYWDGGLCANPAIFPLFHQRPNYDILIIMLHPFRYQHLPNNPTAIRNRFLEISMNSAFLREMQVFARLCEQAQIAKENGQTLGEMENKFINAKFHLIPADKLLQELAFSSKLSASTKTILQLCQCGKEVGKNWINKNFTSIGKNSSINLQEIFINQNFNWL